MAAADGGYGPSNGARNCTNIMARKAKDGSISAGIIILIIYIYCIHIFYEMKFN